jgi:hypothetical protein
MWLWPILSSKYDTVSVEQDMCLSYKNLNIAFTADWIARSKATGRLVLFDFKSVGMLGKSWTEHWPYAIQMHLYLEGIHQEFGEEAEYAQIIGLRKGDEEQGKLRHPYTWAYSNGGDTPNDWSTDWKKGWLLRSVAEYPGGPHEWILRLGEKVGMAQFPFSTPIMFDERMVGILLRQRLAREQEVANVRVLCHADQTAREIYFEHRFSQCRKSFGSPCGYLAACHNAEVAADPLGSGLYIKRTPHHELELIGVE